VSLNFEVKKLVGIYIIGLLALIAPLALKYLATGGVGPRTSFYFFAAWTPFILLATGWMLGRIHLWVHFVFVVSIGVMTWLGFPADPAMDFMRQSSYELSHHYEQWGLWLVLMDFALVVIENRRPLAA